MKESRTSSINRKGQRRRMRLFFFVILCFFVWTSYTLFLQSGELSKKETELGVLKQESAVLQQKQDDLTYEASRLNDQEYLAELVRKRILFTKQGESIYMIPD
ncbi:MULTISPECIES: septum formation initiator family protein [Brevibacillus]|uniref:Putative cell division protein n=1 Tax=Brevibacillus brevis (strain 47 / JCM 6285 / NBRC 100599) TaxID=358681 RepID=C0ZHF1_BREBN|nr:MULTISPECIES: septum formation initiator family protein [Bacillales]NRR05432.1 septum formation initiator family protein [Brevibacillus sp. RS1.1]TQR30022.1 septum formation initiator family protein [Lysinibacillus sp. SDF0063]UIO42693.1 septum formation initiator family protein [Brevibacillus brevis]WJQ81765.1 septum formation initiator family protein [Brevibacillus brevis]BAH41092.1 putative cell division protein [Brevibacillus brevis NBRC 100599]